MFWSSADIYILIDLCRAWPIWLIVGQADQNVNLKFEWFVSRLTDWRTSWWASRRSWRGSPRSWSRPSLKCPDIRSRQCPDIRSKHSSTCLDTNSRHVPKCLNIRCRNSSKCLDSSFNLNRFLEKCWNVNSISYRLILRCLTFSPNVNKILLSRCPATKSAVALSKANIFITAPQILPFWRINTHLCYHVIIHSVICWSHKRFLSA